MATVTLELRPSIDQIAFNLRRWEEVLMDSNLTKVEGRVETDRHGRVIMSPPPAPRHSRLQGQIVSLLKMLLPEGEVLPECAVSTADGVKGVDVAWASPECWAEVGNRSCFVRLPEICIEVSSPSNSEEEIQEKIALYFDASAKEVWVCGTFGAMTFYGGPHLILSKSALCPEFPAQL